MEVRDMNEYLFDVKLFASISVKAATPADARALLRGALDCAGANLGAFPDGTPILAEVSQDGWADLVQVNGEWQA
jgi:hypothetical protein